MRVSLRLTLPQPAGACKPRRCWSILGLGRDKSGPPPGIRSSQNCPLHLTASSAVQSNGPPGPEETTSRRVNGGVSAGESVGVMFGVCGASGSHDPPLLPTHRPYCPLKRDGQSREREHMPASSAPAPPPPISAHTDMLLPPPSVCTTCSAQVM